jgi:hypothetical protein
MSETTLTQPEHKTTAEYKALADQLLADMKRLDELMQKDRDEIDYLKAETTRLQAENRGVLSRLKAML